MTIQRITEIDELLQGMPRQEAPYLTHKSLLFVKKLFCDFASIASYPVSYEKFHDSIPDELQDHCGLN